VYLFRPRLIVSSEVFQVVFIHLVYNSALRLEFCCCCSFLLHVVASLIYMYLVSRQLVLLSTLPEFFRSFFGLKKGVFPTVLLKNFISIDVLFFV